MEFLLCSMAARITVVLYWAEGAGGPAIEDVPGSIASSTSRVCSLPIREASSGVAMTGGGQLGVGNLADGFLGPIRLKTH